MYVSVYMYIWIVHAYCELCHVESDQSRIVARDEKTMDYHSDHTWDVSLYGEDQNVVLLRFISHRMWCSIPIPISNSNFINYMYDNKYFLCWSRIELIFWKIITLKHYFNKEFNNDHAII